MVRLVDCKIKSEVNALNNIWKFISVSASLFVKVASETQLKSIG